MTREGFIKGLVASVGLAALPAPVAAAATDRVSDAKARANYAAYLATIPTEAQPLDPMAALAITEEMFEESGFLSWRQEVGVYAMALWDETQAHRSREWEHALAGLPDSFHLDHLAGGLMYEAMQFGARVGMAVALTTNPREPIDLRERRAAWLARVYNRAEGLA